MDTPTAPAPRTAHRPLLRLVFALVLMAVMWAAVQPAAPIPPLFSWQDKVEHALLFAALAGFAHLAWPRRPGAMIALLLGYGAAMELAQSFTAYRYGDPLDWLADAVGTLAAYGLLTLWRTRARRAAAGPA